jgi:hypothetical protein
MKSYFRDKVGLNADLKRHSEKETFLREKIAEFENSNDELDIAITDAYKMFLQWLLESKAEVASKIGKKVKNETEVKQRIVCSANRYVVKFSHCDDEFLIITGARHWDSICTTHGGILTSM